jgi:hypothetical protein
MSTEIAWLLLDTFAQLCAFGWRQRSCTYRSRPKATGGWQIGGEIQMPTKVNLELIIVWFCVGFFTGAGWAIATWLVGRILGLTHL